MEKFKQELLWKHDTVLQALDGSTKVHMYINNKQVTQLEEFLARYNAKLGVRANKYGDSILVINGNFSLGYAF